MENVIATASQIVEAVKGYDIAFPNLGIYIPILKNTISIGNFTIAYYGIIIAIGMLFALTIVLKLAKIRKINEDYFYDLFMIIIILGIIGARIYYVIFNWDYYVLRPHEIIDIRAGGLAIFGGIIASFVGIAIYCHIKKCKFTELVDLSVVGLTIGQAIGRYGNFFNMEAFGTYTNNLLAMRMKKEYISEENLSFEQLLNIMNIDGIDYVQAHPTFFYESILNIILFIILIFIFYKSYKFIGKLLATYLIGYGIIRVFVESLRTDSLMMGSFRASQIVAIICILIGIIIYIINLTPLKKDYDKLINYINNILQIIKNYFTKKFKNIKIFEKKKEDNKTKKEEKSIKKEGKLTKKESQSNKKILSKNTKNVRDTKKNNGRTKSSKTKKSTTNKKSKK